MTMIQRIVLLFIEGAAAISNKETLNPDRYNKVSTLLSKFKINHFAQPTIVNIGDRLNIYQKCYNKIRAAVTRFGYRLTSTLYASNGTRDYLSATVQAPLLTSMKLLSFLKILLNSILTSMTVIIAVLSCIIIYCLMIIDVRKLNL
eukprot:TRINITY_DN4986_c0_g1_i1.p1 TRINITY_DN4986_c0_g1~~TRINITY_DN4986_c0_g1_i1.p1  ORF type:complete len:146 (+),score=0.48 TRINITY_DN4986_c0_g1_i1:67-504(+)